MSSSNPIITNELATSVITEAVQKKLKLTDDWIIAQEYAEEFMNYALKRSIYFDNNFTHKTFLEYFTAYWIFSNVEKKHRVDERKEIISKYIDNPFWSIVLELLINMIDQDQADYEIIDDLFKEQLEAKIEALPFLLSVLSSIKYKSNSIIKLLITTSLNLLVTTKVLKKNYLGSFEEKVFKALTGFLSNANNHSLFKEVFVVFASTINININSTKALLILYLELCSQAPKNSLRFEREFINTIIDYDNLVNSDPYLILLDPSESSGSTIYEKTKLILTKFGDYYLVNSFQAKYGDLDYYELILLFMYVELSKSRATLFIQNLNSLFKLGLSKIKLLKLLQNRRNVFLFNPDVEEIGKIILSEKDEFIQAILRLIVWKACNDSWLFDVEVKTNFEKLNNSEITTLLSIKDETELNTMLMKEFKLEKYMQ